MFYIQENGECVSQVYEIEANNWEEAKASAWDRLGEGDALAECSNDAIETYQENYNRICEEKCDNYATLNRGVWVTNESGEEDFRKDIWYFSDDEEAYLNAEGKEYDFDSLKKED